MTSHTTKAFRKALAALPAAVRRQAQTAYRLFRRDPHHSSLSFKRVHAKRPIYSARISRDYRAVGVLDKDDIMWFWIGHHDEYERILKAI